MPKPKYQSQERQKLKHQTLMVASVTVDDKTRLASFHSPNLWAHGLWPSLKCSFLSIQPVTRCKFSAKKVTVFLGIQIVYTSLSQCAAETLLDVTLNIIQTQERSSSVHFWVTFDPKIPFQWSQEVLMCTIQEETQWNIYAAKFSPWCYTNEIKSWYCSSACFGYILPEVLFAAK